MGGRSAMCSAAHSMVLSEENQLLRSLGEQGERLGAALRGKK